MGKIKNLEILKKEIVSLRKNGKRVVFTNGCFDILHPGHIKVFQEAKKYGEILVVRQKIHHGLKLLLSYHQEIQLIF